MAIVSLDADTGFLLLSNRTECWFTASGGADHGQAEVYQAIGRLCKVTVERSLARPNYFLIVFASERLSMVASAILYSERTSR
jgi:hypothetical protein